MFVDSVAIPPDRIRKEFNEDHIANLASSIISKGLMHAIVVRSNGSDEPILVAGENRLRAIDRIHDLGQEFYYNAHKVPAGKFPVVMVQDLPEDLRLEAELEENILRADLTWQEQATARARLFKLRASQAAEKGESFTGVKLAEELKQVGAPASSTAQVARDLKLAKHLSDPAVAAAKTEKEAHKIIQKKTESLFLKALGDEVEKEETEHKLIVGDSLYALEALPDEHYSIILTDPPYGIDVQDAGSQVKGAHHYDDSTETLEAILAAVPEELFRVAAPNAHIYWFCDFTWIDDISTALVAAGFTLCVYPIIWDKKGRGIAPDPNYLPRRTYECILYGMKGRRPTMKLGSDVISVGPSSDLQQAEKPVDLLVELLQRSAQPGDRVLDPFCGSGSIFVASSKVKCKATGIEKDVERANLARTRLGGEKA